MKLKSLISNPLREKYIPYFVVGMLAVLLLTLAITWKQKSDYLDQELVVSAKTISSALEAGDWDLVVSHLNSLNTIGGTYNIELFDRSGERISGPIGEPQFQIGSICKRKKIDGLELDISLCKAFLGTAESTYFLLFIAFLIAYVISSYIIFKEGIGLSALVITNELEKLSQLVEANRESDSRLYSQIEEIKAIQISAEKLVRKAKESEKDRAIAEITSQVAHDLRAPLTALEVFKANIGAIGEDQIALFKTATDRLKSICDDVLSIHRGGQVPAAQEFVSLKDLLLDLAIEANAPYDQEIVSSINDPKFSDLQLHLESAQKLGRVLSNLIRNSIESLEHKRDGKVRVLAQQVSRELVIEVSDNGKGIEPSQLEHLFQKGTSFGKFNGNGLGLYSAKKTIEALGGNIQISSQLGNGTQVRVSIPHTDFFEAQT